MAGRIAAFGRHKLAAPLAIAIASRAYSIAALLLITARGSQPIPLLTTDTSPLVAWDGQWYPSIAARGYHTTALQQGPHGGRLDIAFLPAWPALIRVASLNVLSLGAVGVVLASVLFCLAAPTVYLVLERHFGRDAALGGLGLLAFSPAAFVLSMAYTESLFLLLAALYFCMSREGLRPIAVALAMLTRLTGIAIVASAAYTAVWRRSRWAATAVLAGVAALAGWWLATWWLTSDPTAIVRAAAWVNVQGLAAIAAAVLRFGADAYTKLFFVAVVTVASVALVKRSPELAAYCVVTVALGILGGSVTSMPRYVLVAFPAFGFIAWRLGRRLAVVAIVASAVFELAFIWLAFQAAVPQTP